MQENHELLQNQEIQSGSMQYHPQTNQIHNGVIFLKVEDPISKNPRQKDEGRQLMRSPTLPRPKREVPEYRSKTLQL